MLIPEAVFYFMSDNILQKLFKPTSRGKVWWVFVGIIILTLVASIIDFSGYYNRAVDKFKAPFPKVKEIPFRLGLDLLGGSQLTYQADVSEELFGTYPDAAPEVMAR